MVLETKYLESSDYILEKNLVLCLGFFDGLHRAHMELIKEAKKVAKEKNLPLAVFTFSMSVKTFLINERHRCLTTIEDKARICETEDVDYLYVMQVNDSLIHMSANEFITRYLSEAHTVVVGFDFKFGYFGEGDKELLQKQENFQTIVIPQIKYLDLKIGTTRIKANLLEGNLNMVNQLLGRDYSINGRVISGRGIGRRLGYPTANIDYMPYFLPKSGVYYTEVVFNNQKYKGLTNIGNKPTYYHLPLTVETYVFGINQNMYNHQIKLIFKEYIRPEKQFESETKLKEQIMKDIEYVSNINKEERNE